MPRKDLRIDVVKAAIALVSGDPFGDAHQVLEEAVFNYVESERRRLRDQKVRNYRKARKKLIVEMGGKCALCPKKTQLEFDHINTRTWDAAKTSRWARLAKYRREYHAGILRLLCRSCNGSSKNFPKDNT